MADPDPNPRLTPELEATLRRFVLGSLDEAARSALDEQLVTEPDVFEALGVVEDELIEEYLDGTSSDPDRAAFEKSFLTSPQRRARLRLAESLRRHASHAKATEPVRLQPRQSSFRWQPTWLALAAGLVLSLAGNLWLVSRPQAQRAPSVAAPSVAVQPTAVAPTVAPALARAAMEPSTTPTAEDFQREREEWSKAEARVAALEETLRRSRSSVTFVLAAGALRSAGSAQRIVVPSDAMLVHLRLELSGDDYPSYRAVLLDDAGEELWAASKLRAETESGHSFVLLALTPDRLARGDYQVKLSGLTAAGDAEAIGSYPFRVSHP